MSADLEPREAPAPTGRVRGRPDPDRRAELEDERTFLLSSLADLERERDAGDLDDDDERELRDSYTVRLAAVLRELDGQVAAAPPKPPRRWGRTIAVAGAVAVLAVVAGVAVAAFSGQRLPGQAATGDVADSVNKQLAEARVLQSSDPRAAIDRYDAVLKVDPDNPEALTYRGWLIARVGSTAGAADLVDRGEDYLDRAIAVQPTYADPYCFKAIIEFRYRGDAATAKAPVDVCLASNPPQVVRALVEGLQAEIDAALAHWHHHGAARYNEPVTLRIGGGQGFYGDGVEPTTDVLEAGVDYLVCEALAELTLAILQKDRQRDEALGYTRDLPSYVRSALPYVVDGRTKVVTNAGGINPVAAGRAVVDTLKAAGAGGLTVATVVGDDVRPLAAELDLPADTLFANVYLGARPIVEALAHGADIVVTGRVADASLFLAPLVHEHGWAWDDWDRLAAGVAIGHLLECSGSVTGGNYSGPWWENPDPLRIGFPIGEVEADGSAVITKPAAAGSMVTFDTVREQLLYEVHDPRAYLNPDATADFTSLTLDDLGHDRVRVSGVRGGPPPATYKGLVCRPAGWAGEATFAYTWPDAEAKARAAVHWVRARAEHDGLPVREWLEEYFGAGAYHGPAFEADRALMERAGWEPPEVMGRLAWRTEDAETAGRVARGAGVLGLSGPPQIAGFGRARGGKPTQLLQLDAVAVDRALVDPRVRVELTTT